MNSRRLAADVLWVFSLAGLGLLAGWGVYVLCAVVEELLRSP